MSLERANAGYPVDEPDKHENNDLTARRRRPDDVARVRSLLSLVPARAVEALEVGSRDGYIAGHLVSRCSRVLALDLDPLEPIDSRVVLVRGDLLRLPFRDDAFEVVVCAEVLEHFAPASVGQAARELVRVTRKRLVIGVPFEQDIRIGRTTCPRCGKPNPPWGHRSFFSRDGLLSLFAPLRCVDQDLIGRTREATNRLSVWILDRLGNPWGTYDQLEPCIECGGAIRRPRIGPLAWFPAKAAASLARAQTLFARHRPKWIHLAFDKT